MASSDLTIARMRELYSYDPETGAFTRIKSIAKFKVGETAGHINKGGYIVIGIDGVQYYGHRLAWMFIHGESPQNHIDHIDGDTTNNRIANLRQADRSLNMENQRAPKSHNKVGILGVRQDKRSGRYSACIVVKGKQLYLGEYDDPHEAGAAYLDAKRRLHEGCTI